MKTSIILSGIFLIFYSVAPVYAQVNHHGVDTVGRSIDTSSLSNKTIAEQQLIKIKLQDLPEAIAKKLQSDSYQNWVIQDAYRNVALNQYSVRLKKGKDIVFYTFNTSGERIEN